MALRVAALAAVLVVAAGWLLYVRAWRDTGAHPLAYRDLTRAVSPLRPPLATERLFERRSQLVEYLRRARPGSARPPAIDFGRDQALLVSPGPRSSTGYAVRVERVAEERGRIVVDLQELTPTLRNPGRAQVTYPYRLLVFAKRDKPVYLTWAGRP
jgi:hypothetical protein